MRYLHTMLRVRDLDAALDFYCNKLGLTEVRRRVDDKGRYTLVFLARPRTTRWSATGQARPRRAAGRADLQLGHRGLRRGALFRSSGLRGRRHLRDLRTADEGRRHHQPPAPRRRHGVRALPGPALDRAVAEGRAAAAAGTVGLDAQYRPLVSGSLQSAARTAGSRRRPACLLARANHFICRAVPAARFRAAARPSSSGLGRRPFTAETRVRFP